MADIYLCKKGCALNDITIQLRPPLQIIFSQYNDIFLKWVW